MLLRERNLIKTEKYEAWKANVQYSHITDPEEIIVESMANVKKEIERYNKRSRTFNKGI